MRKAYETKDETVETLCNYPLQSRKLTTQSLATPRQNVAAFDKRLTKEKLHA